MKMKRSKKPPVPDPTPAAAPPVVPTPPQVDARARKLERLIAAANRVQRAKQELLFAEAELLGEAGEDVALAAIMSIAWQHPDGSKIEVAGGLEEGEGHFKIPVPR